MISSSLSSISFFNKKRYPARGGGMVFPVSWLLISAETLHLGWKTRHGIGTGSVDSAMIDTPQGDSQSLGKVDRFDMSMLDPRGVPARKPGSGCHILKSLIEDNDYLTIHSIRS
jgi:hypothetical protein